MCHEKRPAVTPLKVEGNTGFLLQDIILECRFFCNVEVYK